MTAQTASEQITSGYMANPPEVTKNQRDWESATWGDILLANPSEAFLGCQLGMRLAAPLLDTPILAGLLATSARWADGLASPKFESAIHSTDQDERIDLGCALKHGAFEMTPRTEGFGVEVSDAKLSLISFMLRLFARLQPIATAKPIDIRQYGKDVW